MNLIIQPAKNSDLKEITSLLLDNQLPTIDINENTVQLFVGLINNEIIGTIGLEKYKPFGLLRSLAVNDEYKNHKIGEKLVKHLFYFRVKINTAFGSGDLLRYVYSRYKRNYVYPANIE